MMNAADTNSASVPSEIVPAVIDVAPPKTTAEYPIRSTREVEPGDESVVPHRFLRAASLVDIRVPEGLVFVQVNLGKRILEASDEETIADVLRREPHQANANSYVTLIIKNDSENERHLEATIVVADEVGPETTERSPIALFNKGADAGEEPSDVSVLPGPGKKKEGARLPIPKSPRPRSRQENRLRLKKRREELLTAPRPTGERTVSFLWSYAEALFLTMDRGAPLPAAFRLTIDQVLSTALYDDGVNSEVTDGVVVTLPAEEIRRFHEAIGLHQEHMLSPEETSIFLKALSDALGYNESNEPRADMAPDPAAAIVPSSNEVGGNAKTPDTEDLGSDSSAATPLTLSDGRPE